jgi:hypothetical protein
VSSVSAATSSSSILHAGGWFVGTGFNWLATQTYHTSGTAAFSISADGLSYSVLSHATRESQAVTSSQPLQIGDGLFHVVNIGSRGGELGVAALYPSEDADTWTIDDSTVALLPSRTSRKGKGVAYVAPNRLAVAGWTLPASGTGAQGTAVAILDVRTPFSGTVPNSSAPTAPLSLVARPLNTAIGVSWAAPLSNGGLPLTSYVVQYKATASSSWTNVSLASPLATRVTISGLTNNVTYDVRVAAVSSAGTGVYAAAQATPALAAPGAPTGLSVTPSGPPPLAYPTSNSRYVLSWTAPASNGGSAITGYVVQAQYVGPSAFPGDWTTLPYGMFSVTFSGTTATVIPPTRFVSSIKMAFRVAAVNGVGTGAFTASSGLVSMN